MFGPSLIAAAVMSLSAYRGAAVKTLAFWQDDSAQAQLASNGLVVDPNQAQTLLNQNPNGQIQVQIAGTTPSNPSFVWQESDTSSSVQNLDTNLYYAALQPDETATQTANTAIPSGNITANSKQTSGDLSKSLETINTALIQSMTLDSLSGIPLPASEKPDMKTVSGSRIVQASSGDTLETLLQKALVPKADTDAVISAMKPHFNPRRLKAGQEVSLDFAKTPEGQVQLTEVRLRTSGTEMVKVARLGSGDQGFSGEIIADELQSRYVMAEGKIRGSLYQTLIGLDVPVEILTTLIRTFSWQVDFQRDVKAGDDFRVVWQADVNAEGIPIRHGKLLYAMLESGGTNHEVYSFEKGDTSGYFTANGSSVQRGLMKTPVEGARISSGFGMRRHPIQGYNKMHKGMDFAAPTGTPIYAAADGVVEQIGRYGAYGNYIRIRHSGNMKTAYAHMSRFARGVSNGSRVRQGDAIGYVGTTGRSTGPHLHYEVLVNNVQVNPAKITNTSSTELAGADLKAFKAHVKDSNATIARLQNEQTVVAKDDSRLVVASVNNASGNAAQ